MTSGPTRADSEPSATEEARIRRVLAGDERAFRQMYREHTPALHRLALRLLAGNDADAQDAVQECWRRAVLGLAGFEGRSALRTWLRGIVVRSCLETVRRNGRNPAADTPAPPPARREPEQRVDLERAFEAMPEGFRTVLVLHDLEGYRHADIAELLGISEGTSKSQLSRGRARLREILGADYVAR